MAGEAELSLLYSHSCSRGCRPGSRPSFPIEHGCSRDGLVSLLVPGPGSCSSGFQSPLCGSPVPPPGVSAIVTRLVFILFLIWVVYD